MATVLVVDDEPEIVQFVSAVLEDEGFIVTTAADGQQAVEVARKAPPDLVVLDMMLPRLDGAGLAKELRRLQGDVPILLMTADGSAAEKASRAGAFAFLSKPFDVHRLLTLVRSRVSP